MKQGKTGRLQVEEHLLPIGVVFVALFWDIEPTLERFVLGEGNLLTMLLPTQPGQT
jgi:hypothetical protein